MLSPIAPEIRSGEGRLALGALLTLFGISAGHSILETARDALFLATLPAARLGLVYLLIAILTLAIFLVGRRRPGASSDVSALATGLVVAAGINVGLWVLLAESRTWLLYGLYLWCGIVPSFVVTGFWLLATGLFSIDQAKRLFAAIGLGAGAGAAIGAATAAVMASYLGARDLVLASGGLFLVAGLGAIPLLAGSHQRAMTTAAPNDTLAADLGHALRILVRDTYLPRVALLGVAAAAGATIIDLVFKAAIAGAVDPADLGVAFGATYFAIHLASLLARIFLVGWLLRTLDAGPLFALAPALMLVGSAGVALGIGLAAIVAAKLIDGSLRDSLRQQTSDLLHLPLGVGLQGRVRSIIDAVGLRGGQILAALLFLVLTGLTTDVRVLGLVAVGFAALALGIALSLARPYRRLFHRGLQGAGLAARIQHPELGRASLETLFARLSSPDDTEVLAALETLAAKGRTRLVPNLVLYHPSSRIVARALALFRDSGRDDFLPITERLLESESATIRAAALRARGGLIVAGTHLPLLSDPDPAVRATAVATMALEESSRTADARKEVHTLLASGSTQEKRAIAEIARVHPDELGVDILLDLADSDDPVIRLAAAEAMGKAGDGTCIPRLIELLADRTVRPAARSALPGFGEPGLKALREVLEDGDAELDVRRHIPGAMADFRPRRAAAALSHALTSADPDIIDAVVRALARLRLQHPHATADSGALRAALDAGLHRVYEICSSESILERGVRRDPHRSTEGHRWLHRLLHSRRASATRSLLAILELAHGIETTAPLVREAPTHDPEHHAASLRKLREALDPGSREAVVALFENIDIHTMLAKAGTYAPPSPGNYEDLLTSCLDDTDAELRALAAYHAAELGVDEHATQLGALADSPDPLLKGFAQAAATVLGARSDRG